MFGLSSIASMLIGAAAIALVSATGAGFAVHHWDQVAYLKLEKQQSDADLQRAKQVLTSFENNTTRINQAAEVYSSNQGVLSQRLDAIGKDLKNVQAKTPLPKDCRPTPDRLRTLTAAVTAANDSATGSGPR